MRLALALLALVLAPRLHAQETLSFQPGGPAACAKALNRTVSTDFDAAFNDACLKRDLTLEQARFDALSKDMEAARPELQVAFNAVTATFAAFRDAHAATEVCRSGPRCAWEQRFEPATMNFRFLLIAERRMTPATATTDGLTAADAALNIVYQKRWKTLPVTCRPSNANCVPQSSLLDTQRDWIRYRDAWLTYATLRWPRVTSESWLTYLTRQRTEQIQAAFPT